jgi:hypothetical protein
MGQRGTQVAREAELLLPLAGDAPVELAACVIDSVGNGSVIPTLPKRWPRYWTHIARRETSGRRPVHTWTYKLPIWSHDG